MRICVAVIASLTVLAAACSSTGLESPAETLRRSQPDSEFGYVIDGAPDGYELCGVGTLAGLSLRPEGVSLFVYGDGAVADPYVGALFGLATFPGASLEVLELGETVDVDVNGVPGRLGTIDGLQLAALPADAGQVLTYSHDGVRIVQLAVRGADDVDLVNLARDVVVSDVGATLPLDSLPSGFVDLGDLYLIDSTTDFLFTIDYMFRPTTGSRDQITLLGTGGSSGAFGSFRFRAGFSELRSLDGNPAVVAELGRGQPGRQVVSWLVEDEVNLRLFSTRFSVDELFAIAQSVRRVDGEEWADLRTTFDPGTCPL